MVSQPLGRCLRGMNLASFSKKVCVACLPVCQFSQCKGYETTYHEGHEVHEEKIIVPITSRSSCASWLALLLHLCDLAQFLF